MQITIRTQLESVQAESKQLPELQPSYQQQWLHELHEAMEDLQQESACKSHHVNSLLGVIHAMPFNYVYCLM